MEKEQSVLDYLVESVELKQPSGTYDPNTQTWTHRDMAERSPQKHHQEM